MLDRVPTPRPRVVVPRRYFRARTRNVLAHTERALVLALQERDEARADVRVLYDAWHALRTPVAPVVVARAPLERLGVSYGTLIGRHRGRPGSL